MLLYANIINDAHTELVFWHSYCEKIHTVYLTNESL